MTAEPFHLSVSDDVLADLRTRPSDTMDRFVAVAADLLAERVGLRPDDPEPQIAAAALLGLWRVQLQSLRRHLATTSDPAI
jgi:hypothetical protein